MPASKDIPAWYRMKLDGLMARLERKLKERGLGDFAATRKRAVG